MPLQSRATLVSALGMVKTDMLYFDLAEFGVRRWGVGGVLGGHQHAPWRGGTHADAYRTVATGHGEVRPPMAGLKSARVAGLGTVFIASAEALDVTENIVTISDPLNGEETVPGAPRGGPEHDRCSCTGYSARCPKL